MTKIAAKVRARLVKALRENCESEIRAQLFEAIKAGPVWRPDAIEHLRAARRLGVDDTAKFLRATVAKLGSRGVERLPFELISLTRMMVDRLNWLAKDGKLGSAPRGFETWPINYAPDASKGAGKWEAAYDLYHELGCGRDGFIPRGASKVDYEDRWTELVVDGLRAAWLARLYAPWVDERKSGAIHIGQLQLHQKATKLACDYYLCDDGEVIVWPVWADKCRDLPKQLTKTNCRDFLPIIRELVRLYLIADEAAMRKYMHTAGAGECREWNADVFNNHLMPRVSDALNALARKRR